MLGQAEQIEAQNQRGAPTVMTVTEIDPADLKAPDRMLPGTEGDGGSELIAAYSVDQSGGNRVAEAITFGAPDGIRFRFTLVGLGMRQDVWECLMMAEETIGGLVHQYWLGSRW